MGHRTSSETETARAHGAGRTHADEQGRTEVTERKVLRTSLLRAGGVASVLAIALSGGAYAAVRAAGPETAPLDVARSTLVGIGAPSGTGHDGEQAGSASTGMRVPGAQTTVSTTTEDSEQAYETVREETASLPEGQTRVKTAGVNGAVRTTYQVTASDGQETSREVLSQVLVTEKVDEVVLVGTGAAAGTGSAGSVGGPAAAASSGATASGDAWAALAQCESGGNPTTNTGNGYYGMYQFTVGTWRSLGGTGLPSEASAEEQTAMAQRLQARSGWGQWPACASRLGLR